MNIFIKNQKGISLINILLVIIIIIVGIIIFKAITNDSNIENIVLSKENFQETMDEYSKLKHDTDDIVYAGYAIMYYMTSDYITNAFMSGAINEENAYINIYGKTLKELKEEGKELMKNNNITVEQFRKNMQNIQ